MRTIRFFKMRTFSFVFRKLFCDNILAKMFAEYASYNLKVYNFVFS